MLRQTTGRTLFASVTFFCFLICVGHGHDVSVSGHVNDSVCSNVLVMGMLQGDLIGVESTTGTILWRLVSGGPLVRKRAAQTQRGSTLHDFIPCLDGTLVSYSGDEPYVFPYSTWHMVDTSPSVAPDGTLILGAKKDQFFSIDPSSGTILKSSVPSKYRDSIVQSFVSDAAFIEPPDIYLQVLRSDYEVTTESFHAPKCSSIWAGTDTFEQEVCQDSSQATKFSYAVGKYKLYLHHKNPFHKPGRSHGASADSINIQTCAMPNFLSDYSKHIRAYDPFSNEELWSIELSSDLVDVVALVKDVDGDLSHVARQTVSLVRAESDPQDSSFFRIGVSESGAFGQWALSEDSSPDYIIGKAISLLSASVSHNRPEHGMPLLSLGPSSAHCNALSNDFPNCLQGVYKIPKRVTAALLDTGAGQDLSLIGSNSVAISPHESADVPYHKPVALLADVASSTGDLPLDFVPTHDDDLSSMAELASALPDAVPDELADYTETAAVDEAVPASATDSHLLPKKDRHTLVIEIPHVIADHPSVWVMLILFAVWLVVYEIRRRRQKRTLKVFASPRITPSVVNEPSPLLLPSTPKNEEVVPLPITRQVSSQSTQDAQSVSSAPARLSRYKDGFEEISKLGKGGFGSVYLARCKIDQRQYAIKKIKLENQLMYDLVLREVLFLARFDHVNIIRYYTAWTEVLPEGFEHSDTDSDDDGFYDSEATSSLSVPDTHSLQPSTSSHLLGLPDPLEVFGSSNPLYTQNNFLSLDRSFQTERLLSPSVSSLWGDNSAADLAKHARESLSDATPDADEGKSPRSFSNSRLIVTDPSSLSLSESHTSIAVGAVPSAGQAVMLYIQMQHCAKGTLADWLEEEQRSADDEDVIHIFKQIVRGVAHVHEEGLIHRDLKPTNIFIEADRTVRIGDFGLSKSAEDTISRVNELTFSSGRVSRRKRLKHMTSRVGSPLYCSPEQLHGHPCTEKVDIFSLGIILVEMLNRFGTKMERNKVLGDARKRDVKFSDESEHAGHLKPLCLRMLSENPAERPSAQDVLNVLEPK